MTQSTKLSQQERDAILKALRAGKSQNAVARECGRSVGSVNAIARESGLDYSAPKNALVCLNDYNASNRLKLLNKFFEKATEIVEHVNKPAELQSLAVALAVLIDKRRLEDGEVTSRSENVNADVARERVASFVDELATRRRAKEATG